MLSRDELLTLPEFVLLSLFPNGLFPEGHMGGASENDAVQVDVSLSEIRPAQYSARIAHIANVVPLESMIQSLCSIC